MKVFNNTPMDVAYDVTWSNGGDCGSLGAGESYDDAAWNNMKNIQVSFNALPAEPSGVTPFSITIDETNEGMAVTIGLYSE